MVDPIGNKAGAVADRRPVSVAAPSPAGPAPAVRSVASQLKPVESTAAELSAAMASKPPVDAERVARIRKAIEDGRFPLYPATVADRLLALKLEWDPNESA